MADLRLDTNFAFISANLGALEVIGMSANGAQYGSEQPGGRAGDDPATPGDGGARP